MNRGKLVWVPAFLAGAAAATSAELSAGLLLYSGIGFLRALTVILTVQMGAFALGLWTAWSSGERRGVEHLRRRWLFALVAFTAAAAFAGVARVLGAPASRGFGQGLGLGLLGALPMFATGALLGSMGRVMGRGTRGGVTIGVGAAWGAATGFLASGFAFIPTLEPSSTLLVCVIALSAGALIHGWVLDQQEVAEELESRWTARGRVRVEDRARGAPQTRRRVLLESGRVRGSEYLEGPRGLDWTTAVLAAVAGFERPVTSVLVYGTGAGTLARGLLGSAVGSRSPDEDGGAPTLRVVGIEPNAEVRRLAMAHFPPGRPEGEDPWSGIELRDGLLLSDLDSMNERFDLVVVDATALGPPDVIPPVLPAALAPALDRLRPEGSLVVGGLVAPTAQTRPGLEAWMAEAETLGADRRALVAGGDLFLVISRDGAGPTWSGNGTQETGRWTAATEGDTSLPHPVSPPDPTPPPDRAPAT